MVRATLRSMRKCHGTLSMCWLLLAVVPAAAQSLEPPGSPPERFQTIDLDAYMQQQPDPWLLQQRYHCAECLPNTRRPRFWQVLPEGLIYHSYLAGPKEPRMGTQWFYEKDDGWLWDTTLGGRVGLLRWGTLGPASPQGFQIDLEAAAFLRQDLVLDLDMRSIDLRAGVPLTYSFGRYQGKVAYYHLSAHLGDELIIRTPAALAARRNFVRDAIVWGHSYYVTDDVRLYFEAGWAFRVDGGSEPWELQFGIDYSPACAVGPRGAPFVAVNAHLREEVNFGGSLVVQAGWQWRGRVGGPVMRVGLHYYNGESPHYEFFDESEQQLGLGLWYDF